jgi:predicted nuclease with RNAse H fold
LIVVGIDLAGSPKRNTGVCILKGNRITSYATLFPDEDILAYVKMARPDLIAVDAPLNLPPGRKTIEDRNGEHFRPCDRELHKRGIRFFPITLGPMRSLTTRGILLKKRFRRLGFTVIEIYPGAAQDIWNIPRKQIGLGALRRGLERLGIRGLTSTMNGDELVAVSGAIVGKMFLQGKAEILGDFKRGAIVVPLPVTEKRRTRRIA